ncbi:MAG: PfkB domain protein [Xanthobacteraceae bacterium]|jgi:fructokinase|nr:PfkB domain protein [Xanthobacteraceae bacterium]
MLLSCGDALIDFMPASTADGRDGYVTAVGGSCLNVAVAMARLDAPSGLVGGISTDMFGAMIADHAQRSKVDLAHVARSEHETTLAFVRFVEGEPHYAFYDEGTAARRWTYEPGSIDFSAAEALHVGSTTLISDPTYGQTLALVEDARRTVTISFDPNCRPALVRDRAAYAARMEEFARRADIVRLSDVDFAYLHGDADEDAKAAELLAGNASLVVLTRGAEGVTAWHRAAGKIEVPAPQITLADTIGAGDSFQGALLAALRETGHIGRPRLAAMSAAALREVLGFAVACAAITCSRVGADPPYRSEVAIRLGQGA